METPSIFLPFVNSVFKEHQYWAVMKSGLQAIMPFFWNLPLGKIHSFHFSRFPWKGKDGFLFLCTPFNHYFSLLLRKTLSLFGFDCIHFCCSPHIITHPWTFRTFLHHLTLHLGPRVTSNSTPIGTLLVTHENLSLITFSPLWLYLETFLMPSSQICIFFSWISFVWINLSLPSLN